MVFRWLLPALALLVLPLSGSASPAASVDDYLAARDRYVALQQQFDQAPQELALAAACRVDCGHERGPQLNALADLERRLRALIEPAGLPATASHGLINLYTLSPTDWGFGVLDGLRYRIPARNISIVVSTVALFQKWLVRKDGDKRYGRHRTPMDSIDAELRSDSFYYFATPNDAGISRFAVLPITKPPAADFAFAMVAARSQDYAGGFPPDELMASLVVHGKVYVFEERIAPLEALVGCSAIMNKAEPEAGSHGDSYLDQADRNARDCYAAQLARQGYDGLTHRAQNLLSLIGNVQ